jgi:hypothetical protein
LLEEAIYSALAERRLPTVANTRPALDLVAENLRELNRRRLTAANTILLVRAGSAPLKLVTITGRLAGHRAVFRGAYIVKPGDTVAFRATYKYDGRKPEVLVLELSIGGEKRRFYALFPPRSERTVEVSRSVSEPGHITCRAVSKPRPEMPVRYIIDRYRLYAELSQTYPVGVLDDRYKPISEYPVSGTYNAVLDVSYRWRVENRVYPSPPAEVVFDNLSVSYLSGFVLYEGKYYKDPSVNNTVRVTARVVNRSSYTLTARHYGLVVAVLYEDDRHVSQVNVSVSFPDITLSPDASRSYHFDVNLPAWAYGKVAVAHALRFYRGGTLFWTGGPLYCFEVFRLRLP